MTFLCFQMNGFDNFGFQTDELSPNKINSDDPSTAVIKWNSLHLPYNINKRVTTEYDKKRKHFFIKISKIFSLQVEKDVRNRDQWGNSIEFLLSCIALSVGLGNIWRFPFIVNRNGGGAFLIPYIIILTLVGRPMYYMEMALGQFSSRGTIQMYEKLSPVFKCKCNLYYTRPDLRSTPPFVFSSQLDQRKDYT